MVVHAGEHAGAELGARLVHGGPGFDARRRLRPEDGATGVSTRRRAGGAAALVSLLLVVQAGEEGHLVAEATALRNVPARRSSDARLLAQR